MSSRFYAGVARSDITPPVGIAHGNWAAQVHERAEGVDLPLYCTALAASDGEEEVIIAEWELGGPPDGEWLAEIRQRITDLTGIPASHIRISATHTHSGPNLTPPWFDAGVEMIEPYRASLADRLAGTCLAAHNNLQPARVGGGKGSCAVNASRRSKWKPDRPLMAPNFDTFIDREVGVIRIDSADSGQPIAILVNYAAHPTILAWDNRLISPDYPGTVRRTVENIVGGTCLYLQGAAGNQDTIRDFGNRVEDARWVGRQIGLEASRVAELIETQPTKMEVDHYVESSWTMGVVKRVPVGEPDGTVRCISRRVALPLNHREPPTEDELAEVQALKQNLADLRAKGAPKDEIREANRLARRAGLGMRVINIRSGGTEQEIEFQAIRLGPTALVGIPVEPFSEIGAAVKTDSPFETTFFSGYTNGVNLYLPVAEAFEQGGYEVWVSPYAPEAAGVSIEASLNLLRDLAN